MNRPGVTPQSLRGIPNGFPSQQQQLPQNRSVSSRLPPSAKMSNNGATWAFGGGVPMGSAGLGNPRPNNGPITSFAQTIGNSNSTQQAASLDLSEFPSLSNNQSQPSQSTWAASGTRNIASSGSFRLQQQSLSSQQQLNAQQQTQQQQDDLFSSSSQLPSSHGAFRFGSQNAVGQSSQSSNTDEFPPLNRNANGEIGQDRSSNVIQSAGFGTSTNGLGFGSATASQARRSNGLLSALTGSNRVTTSNRVTSPVSLSGASNSRSPMETNRRVSGGVSENETSPFTNTQFSSSIPQRDNNLTLPNIVREGAPQQLEGEMPLSQAPASAVGSSQGHDEDLTPEYQDPLAHMNEIDKWGIKGFTFMMNNYPDYAALVSGSDVNNLGFDVTAAENYSSQIYSLWDNEPCRPPIPRYALPECYRVINTAQIDSKMSNFNDEALIFMFYSNPGALQQILAATELHNRNWRYHKKLQLWLTKDDMMVPQAMGNGSERGYYIFFDIKQWHRERRELTLVYEDLENVPAGPRGL